MATGSRRGRELTRSSTVAIADEARRLRSAGVDVVDLSAARAPEPTPPSIIEAARASLHHATHQTPARGTEAFRRACALKLARDNDLRIDPDREVMATLGVKHGTLLALMATIDPGDVVLVEDPCFVSHAPLVELAGGIPRSIRLDPAAHWSWPRLTDAARAVIMCNPHNPTGVVRTDAELGHIARECHEHDLWVISDEVYERVLWGGRRHRCIATLDGMHERTITLMSTTKSFAMGGWRIGLAAAPPLVIDAMVKLHAHAVTCAPAFAQSAAMAAFGSISDDVAALWAAWEARCVSFAERLDALPRIRCPVPESGFVAWVDVRETGIDDRELAARLLADHHVAVIPGGSFGPGGAGYLRVCAVKDEATAAAAIERLAACLHATA